MVKRNEENCKHWGLDSTEWGIILVVVFILSVIGFVLPWSMENNVTYYLFVYPVIFVLPFILCLRGWWIALSRSWEEDERVKKEEARLRPPVRSVDTTAEIAAFLAELKKNKQKPQAEAPYKKVEAELSARMEHAKKMQRLHALRQQVEEEERKAGIFVPTLSPAQPQAGSRSVPPAISAPAAGNARALPAPAPADPMAAQMAQLAQRRQEAERQKHLMKSLRTVEDAEWQADDI